MAVEPALTSGSVVTAFGRDSAGRRDAPWRAACLDGAAREAAPAAHVRKGEFTTREEQKRIFQLFRRKSEFRNCEKEKRISNFFEGRAPRAARRAGA